MESFIIIRNDDNHALVAANSVLVPVEASYLPVLGLQMLFKIVSVVKKRLNKKLKIEGIAITMVDKRTNLAKDISAQIREVYGSTVGVFDTYIPKSVKIAKCPAFGGSIYAYEPKGKSADAYQRLTQKVLSHEK